MNNEDAARVIRFRRKWLEAAQESGEAAKRERIAYHERDLWKARALEAEAALASAGLMEPTP